ncbi:hypothetical protein HQ560_15295 [bacterium]|nr:hypothetical protein [bacterium]
MTQNQEPYPKPMIITSMRRLFIPLVAFLLLAPGSVWATWYQENVTNGADIIMMDLRWPWWPSGTYYANWNTNFNPKPNNISFYAGFTAFVPDGPGSIPNPDEKIQASFRPGSVWTFWGSDKQGTPVRFTDVAPNLFIKNDYGAEGSSGTMGTEVWPFVQCQAMVFDAGARLAAGRRSGPCVCGPLDQRPS